MKSLVVFLCLVTSLCFANAKPTIRISDGARAQAPLLTVRDYTYTVDEKNQGVQFRFGKADAEKLSAISRRYVGKRLSFAVGNSVVSSPRMLDPLTGEGILLTFPDRQSLRGMENALSGGTSQQ